MADRDTRYVDPMFYIPDGISSDTWAYREENSSTDSETAIEGDETYGEVDSDVTIVDEGDASADDAPMFIDNLTVLSQTLRRASDGSLVVDIVVDVDDIPGTTKYEFRITKF